MGQFRGQDDAGFCMRIISKKDFEPFVLLYLKNVL